MAKRGKGARANNPNEEENQEEAESIIAEMARKFRKWMIKNKFSQAQLSEKIGYNDSMLSRFLNEHTLGVPPLSKFGKTFGISFDSLLRSDFDEIKEFDRSEVDRLTEAEWEIIRDARRIGIEEAHNRVIFGGPYASMRHGTTPAGPSVPPGGEVPTGEGSEQGKRPEQGQPEQGKLKGVRSRKGGQLPDDPSHPKSGRDGIGSRPDQGKGRGGREDET